MKFADFMHLFSSENVKFVQVYDTLTGDPLEIKESEPYHLYKVKNCYLDKNELSIYISKNVRAKVKLKNFLKIYNRPATDELKNEHIVKIIDNDDNSKFMQIPIYKIPSKFKSRLVEKFYFDENKVLNIFISSKKKRGDFDESKKINDLC